MYKLKPAFSADAKVTPKQIVYKLPSYHPELGTHDSTDVEMTESDPVKVLEARQVQLIAALNAQAAKLNELFSKMGKPAKKESVQVSKKDASPVKENSQEKDLSKTPPKKDKDAKKEARKAAKVEAKSKVTGEKNPQHTDAPKARNVTPMEVSWVVYEDKKTIETGQSLTANLPSALLSAQQQKLGAISVVIAPEDKPWLERLSAIGSKRNVAFVGDVANSVKSAGTTVTVRSGNAFSLTDGKGLNVSSRITAWKLLGSALGIFTSEFTHAISSTHQHQWMVKAERVLSGSQKGDATYLEREASQFLSRFDSLSGLFDVSIADVIVRSLLKGDWHSNNVELWAKRVDSTH